MGVAPTPVLSRLGGGQTPLTGNAKASARGGMLLTSSCPAGGAPACCSCFPGRGWGSLVRQCMDAAWLLLLEGWRVSWSGMWAPCASRHHQLLSLNLIEWLPWRCPGAQVEAMLGLKRKGGSDSMPPPPPKAAKRG